MKNFHVNSQSISTTLLHWELVRPLHQEWFSETPPYFDLVQIPPHLWLLNPAALLFWIASLFVSHASLGSQVTSLQCDCSLQTNLSCTHRLRGLLSKVILSKKQLYCTCSLQHFCKIPCVTPREASFSVSEITSTSGWPETRGSVI